MNKPVGGPGGSSMVLEAGTGSFSCPFEISLHTNLRTIADLPSARIQEATRCLSAPEVQNSCI